MNILIYIHKLGMKPRQTSVYNHIHSLLHVSLLLSSFSSYTLAFARLALILGCHLCDYIFTHSYVREIK